MKSKQNTNQFIETLNSNVIKDDNYGNKKTPREAMKSDKKRMRSPASNAVTINKLWLYWPCTHSHFMFPSADYTLS